MPSMVLDMNETVAQLRTIKPRQVICYHSGHLAMDSGTIGRGGEISFLGSEAWKLHEAGRAHLVQRRRPDGSVPAGYDYLAIGASSH